MDEANRCSKEEMRCRSHLSWNTKRFTRGCGWFLYPLTQTRPSGRVQRRRLLLGAVVVILLVLLMLPIRALGGKTIAGSGPVTGHEYVVRSGDTLASIATQVDSSDVVGMEQQLAHELGSTVLVPGEHLLIP